MSSINGEIGRLLAPYTQFSISNRLIEQVSNIARASSNSTAFGSALSAILRVPSNVADEIFILHSRDYSSSSNGAGNENRESESPDTENDGRMARSDHDRTVERAPKNAIDLVADQESLPGGILKRGGAEHQYKSSLKRRAEPSLLGLDRLAMEKRRERAENEESIRDSDNRRDIYRLENDEFKNDNLETMNRSIRYQVRRRDQSYGEQQESQRHRPFQDRKESSRDDYERRYRDFDRQSLEQSKRSAEYKDDYSKRRSRSTYRSDDRFNDRTHGRYKGSDRHEESQNVGNRTDRRDFGDRDRSDDERDYRRRERGYRWSKSKDKSNDDDRYKQNAPQSSRFQADSKYLRGSAPYRKDKHDNTVSDDDESWINDQNDWNEEQARLDRDWYNADEFGNVYGEESHNVFSGFESLEHEQDAALSKSSEQMQRRPRQDTRAMQRRRENDLWEQNLMRRTGVSGVDSMTDIPHVEEEQAVQLLVHQLRPPFLDGQQLFSTQKETVSAVRDPDGDLAKLAVCGSRIVRERRSEKERQAAAARAASVAGTALGNLMGVKEDEEDSDDIRQMANDQSNDSKKDQNRMSNGDKNRDVGISLKESIARQKIREQRESLPAFAVRDKLLSVIRDNQVTIVIGETGSGKTTQLTQYLYEDGYSSEGLMIGCTQPRRVAAMSVAKRVSEEMGCALGETVGYTIRFEDCTSSKTAIKYLTEGVLLRESITHSDLDRYSVLIMDEAHERALNMDILLGLLKRLLARRSDFRLVVTSATMNAERFVEFFGNAPSFTIPGRTFPVDILFARSLGEDYVESAVKQVLQIHLSAPAGDILVFMTGQEDIEMTCEIVRERLTQLDDPPKLAILPIYSQMPADLQAKIFEAADPDVRKVVVATNIAETSLTVDGVRYVVDTGFAKVKVFNPRIGMDALRITPISQANAAQRAGRAGRTAPGVAYRLYPESAFKTEMYPQAIPEIQRTNLANTVLLLKTLGVEDLLDFDFLDPPPQETMIASLYDLWTLGAVNNSGRLTQLGRRMAAFPMEPSMGKLLLMSDPHGCSEEVLTIVSMLSVPSVFHRPKERADEADAQFEKFAVSESDHLTLLNIFNMWRAHGFRDRWAAEHFLQPRALRRAREIRLQLAEIMEKQGIRMASCNGDWDVVRRVLCTGYFHHAARVKGLGEYAHLRTGVPCNLHPTSSLYGLGFLPDYVIYHELMFTSKEYMSVVTAVEPEWLAETGSMFYSIRSRGSTVTRADIDRRFRSQIEAEIRQDQGKLVDKSLAGGHDTAAKLVNDVGRVRSYGSTFSSIKQPVRRPQNRRMAGF